MPPSPRPTWDAYQDYGHNHWHNSLLWGEDIHDFSITGTGLIWGKGLSFGAGRAARGNYPIYIAEQPGVGNKAIALKNCRNVLLRDFSILKGGHFGLLLTGVDNLTIDNLKIDTDRDGMDIDCCQNVRVSNCTVNSPWDDGICPKSSYALGYARPTRNVTITNCWVTGCYELGTVLDGTFKRFAARRARPRHRPHQVRHGIQWRLHQHHHLQLRLRGLPGICAGNRRWRAARRHHHHQHHHARPDLGPHLHAPGRAAARPEGNHEGGNAEAHPDQQSRLLQRAACSSARSSAAFPATRLKT